MKHNYLKHMFTALLLLVATVASAQDFEVDGIYYNITDATNKTVEVARSNYTGSITIPVQVTNNKVTYTVTSIGSLAFYNCSGLTSVEIPNSVTAIQDQTFEYCTNLQSVTIPSSVKSIGYRSFENCHSLQTVNLSEGLSSIGVCAFQYCVNLHSTVIPSSVTTVNSYAFRDCSKLESVTFCATTAPAVTDAVFNGISSTAVLRYPAGSDYSAWKSFFASTEEYATTIGGSCGTSVDWTLADGVLTITGNGAMDDYPSSSAPWNEYKDDIRSVVIEEGVTSIGDYAFVGSTSLTNIEIPNSVISIGDFAFNNCDGLVSIEIPNSVISIGNYAFHACDALENIKIPNSIKSIGYGAFSFTAWYYKQSDGAILYLSKFLLGYKTWLSEENIIVEDGTLGIAGWAFERCTRLASVVIPNSVTSIGECAFSDCSGLKSIEIPNSVTSIENRVFYGCSGLINLTIGNNVASIGGYAFANCSSLTSVTSLIPADALFTVSTGVFNGVDKTNCTLYVPYGAKETYEATEGWKDFTNIVELAPGAIGGTCGAGVSWTFADGVLTITGNGAMDDYTWESTAPWSVYANLIECVVIEDGVTTIGEFAFKGYSGLKSIEIPNSVTRIGLWAFYDCENLTEVEIPNSVTVLESGVFAYCDNLANVVIPNSVTSIGVLSSMMEGPFEGCKSLREIKIPNSVTTIGDCAFNNCTALENIEIPSSVTSIGYCAFNWCAALENIEIPSSVTSIGYCAFGNCTALESVTSLVPADELFEAYAFDGLDFDACTLYVPYGAKATYASTSGWNYFTNIVELRPSEITITINQYGSGTYCSDFALDFSNVEGLKAYAATGYNVNTGVITLTRLQTAREGTGLFLKGEPGDEYVVPVLEETGDHSLNMLVGTLKETTVNSISSDDLYANYMYTIMEDADESTPMFYRLGESIVLPANMAYLQIPLAWLQASASKSVEIRFDDGETTDIDEVEGENGDAETVYDLQGRAVENPTKGIYIVDGKKVFIK